MKITNLEIKNFRAISRSELHDLGDMVVIAGPNGCGKSCIFDAIRLIKSVYGGYQRDEWQQWFGEFHINVARWESELIELLQDRREELRIHAEIELADVEREYIYAHAKELIKPLIWERVLPEAGRRAGKTPPAREIREHSKKVEEDTETEASEVRSELKKGTYCLELTLRDGKGMHVTPSSVMEIVFSVYEPDNVGVLDFHGANRSYQREKFSSIKLNIESEGTNYSQHALYNYMQKYANIKSEMARVFVRELLIKESGANRKGDASLAETLRELFSTFFPGKEFNGAVASAEGRLSFPVRLATGGIHDIDDLSSGETEVLYGYLRLRNSSPRNSILLLDEPELHLNPRLIRGLPQFYHEHLGKVLGNQIWLTTHSDTFLRQAVSQPGFSVFHMQGPDTAKPGENQMHPIEAAEALDRAVIDLVGDLASYRPRAKVVIFEGGGESEFDVRMTCRLFPEFEKEVNAIAGGPKRQVRDLHELLNEAALKGELGARFFCIVDKDTEESIRTPDGVSYSWDVYHIENYLIEPRYIWRVLDDLDMIENDTKDEQSIERALLQCAEQTLQDLVRHKLESEANRRLIACIKTGTPRGADDLAMEVAKTASASFARVEELLKGELAIEKLVLLEKELIDSHKRELTSKEWKRSFRGRDILKRFVGRYVNRKNLQYEDIRN